MKISVDINTEGYFIRSYAPGRITIAFPRSSSEILEESAPASGKFQEEILENSFILTSNSLIKDWSPKSITDLNAQHAEQLISLQPEVIILGTGHSICFPDQSWMASFYQNGIGLEIMDTGAACRTFSILASDGRNVAAAMMQN